jgi:hypothetical protein
MRINNSIGAQYIGKLVSFLIYTEIFITIQKASDLPITWSKQKYILSISKLVQLPQKCLKLMRVVCNKGLCSFIPVTIKFVYQNNRLKIPLESK